MQLCEPISVGYTVKRSFIIWIFFPFCFCLKGQDAGEIVAFKEEVKDLGVVKKGALVKDQFVFTNISEDTVQIDIVSTCECTDAKWTMGEIPPGSNGKIDFTFKSAEKDKVEPIDVDVYFLNVNPRTGNPYSIFLRYTFRFSDN